MEDLDTLGGMAAAADTLNAPAPAGVSASDVPAEPQPPGLEEQALDMVNAFAGLMAGYCPATAEVWDEGARVRSAAAIAPLMEKYNFSLMAVPPELTAAIVVGPLLYRSATMVADKVRADRAEAAARKAAEQGAARQQSQRATEHTGIAPGATQDGSGPAVPVHPQMALYAS